MSDAARPDREWRRAAALFALAATTSIAQTSVLLAVPFLVLVGLRGIRSVPVALVSLLAMLIVVSGFRDGIWYVERAWALIVGGWFAAITLAGPRMRLSSKILGAVGGAVLSCLAYLGLRSGSWVAIDFAVKDRVQAGVASTLDAFAVLRDGQSVSPALATAVYEAAAAQTAVFPAITGIASMASLAVAWWVYARLSRVEGPVLGPLRDFRFNDHLVWIFVVGLLLLLTRWSEGYALLGSNAVVFMGALYALRGAAVFVFMSGGLSLAGTVLFAFSILLMAPVVLGAAMVLGIGDTWLDVRSRLRNLAA